MADTMSARVDDGGPAFPRDGFIGPNDYQEWPERGMSLRDYFAGQALIATYLNGFAGPDNDRRAEVSYQMADAMLKAREPKS